MVKNWRYLYSVDKSTKLAREVFKVDLLILEGVSKTFTSGPPQIGEYDIVSSTPSVVSI